MGTRVFGALRLTREPGFWYTEDRRYRWNQPKKRWQCWEQQPSGAWIRRQEFDGTFLEDSTSKLAETCNLMSEMDSVERARKEQREKKLAAKLKGEGFVEYESRRVRKYYSKKANTCSSESVSEET